ncbi:hypothetical protein B4Q13_19805 [Lacticaseibacillus rhamnosus]
MSRQRRRSRLDAVNRAVLLPLGLTPEQAEDRGFKKDRFYIYQARWRPDLPMAHILPHWNWPGRVGECSVRRVDVNHGHSAMLLW